MSNVWFMVKVQFVELCCLGQREPGNLGVGKVGAEPTTEIWARSLLGISVGSGRQVMAMLTTVVTATASRCGL